MSAMCKFFSMLLLAGLAACSGSGDIVDKIQQSAGVLLEKHDLNGLTTEEITAGLKQALNNGTNTVVSRLGKTGGFSADPAIKIRLPRALLEVKNVADKFGLGSHFLDLEKRLNRAAEKASPLAKNLFVNAIKDMSLADARGILQGPDNAATQYFQEKTSAKLKNKMQPIVADSLAQVGAVRSFNSLLDAYHKIPGVPGINANLSQHVVAGSVKGIFHYVAEEEKAIRKDPVKRTSELLKRVFASQ